MGNRPETSAWMQGCLRGWPAGFSKDSLNNREPSHHPTVRNRPTVSVSLRAGHSEALVARRPGAGIAYNATTVVQECSVVPPRNRTLFPQVDSVGSLKVVRASLPQSSGRDRLYELPRESKSSTVPAKLSPGRRFVAASRSTTRRRTASAGDLKRIRRG